MRFPSRWAFQVTRMNNCMNNFWILVALVCLAGCDQRIAPGPRANAEAVSAIRAKLTVGGAPAEGEAAAGGDTGGTESSGWATLSGSFKYVGTPPTPANVQVNAECSKHPVVNEAVVVSSDGGLANAVIFLRTAKPQVHADYEASSKDSVVLDNKHCRFEPHVAVMRAGQPLQVKNSDEFGHNTKIDPLVNSPSNAILPAGASANQDFPKEEQLPIKVGCNIHPWMGGWIVVRENPYAAVSDAQGKFTLKNLPAGRELEFQLWQEKPGFLKSVEVAGAPVKVDAKGALQAQARTGQGLGLGDLRAG